MTAAFMATFETVWNEAESTELATASSDHLFLWDDNEIPPWVQNQAADDLSNGNFWALGCCAQDLHEPYRFRLVNFTKAL